MVHVRTGAAGHAGTGLDWVRVRVPERLARPDCPDALRRNVADGARGGVARWQYIGGALVVCPTGATPAVAPLRFVPRALPDGCQTVTLDRRHWLG